MPDGWDGGPFFLTWLELGPLAEGGCAELFQEEGGQPPPKGDTRAHRRDEEMKKRPPTNPVLEPEPPPYAKELFMETAVALLREEREARKDKLAEFQMMMSMASEAEDEMMTVRADMKQWIKENPPPTLESCQEKLKGKATATTSGEDTHAEAGPSQGPGATTTGM